MYLKLLYNWFSITLRVNIHIYSALMRPSSLAISKITFASSLNIWIFLIQKWNKKPEIKIDLIYILQCKRKTRVSDTKCFNRFFISALFKWFFFIFNFTTDKISKRLLLEWLVCSSSAALRNWSEPEKSVTIKEYLNHSYRASRPMIASAWWYSVEASWISLPRGKF